MAEMEKKPWRFTIEFDEEKAKRNGYSVDDLYDCVGKYAEQMGNVRIGLVLGRQRTARCSSERSVLFAPPFLNSLGSCRTLSLGVPMRI
mgnify:FL=1